MLFLQEVCDFLNNFGAAIPRSGRAIACLLSGTKIKGKIKKEVGDFPGASIRKVKSLKCKEKKSGVVGNGSASA
jgi:hypothetical protein